MTITSVKMLGHQVARASTRIGGLAVDGDSLKRQGAAC